MKKYQIIYADPPWDYGPPRNIIRKDGTRAHSGYGAAGYYPTMKTEDICKLPIKELSDKNCALFIWTTFHHLFETEKVIKAWGFKYCTLGFVWIKFNMNTKTIKKGMGYYTRANPELCLMGLKGRMADKVKDKSISSVVLYPLQEHSRKPLEIRKRIEKLFGDIPRIELFARKKWEGWDSWGNEIESEIKI